MKPLTTSRYTMDLTVPEPNLPHPIIGSVKGSTHEQWTYAWITRLVGYVTDDCARNMFTHAKVCMGNLHRIEEEKNNKNICGWIINGLPKEIFFTLPFYWFAVILDSNDQSDINNLDFAKKNITKALVIPYNTAQKPEFKNSDNN